MPSRVWRLAHGSVAGIGPARDTAHSLAVVASEHQKIPIFVFLSFIKKQVPTLSSSWCTNDTWFTSPLASAENFKSQVCFHYFTLLTIVFLPLCPGRGTAVAIHFASFFSTTAAMWWSMYFSHYFYLFMLKGKRTAGKARHSLFRQSTIHGRPCTWLRNSPGKFPWTAAPTVRWCTWWSMYFSYYFYLFMLHSNIFL